MVYFDWSSSFRRLSSARISVKASCDGLPLLFGVAAEAGVTVVIPWGLAAWWGGTGDCSRSRCTSICHSCSASSCDIYSYILLLVIFNILVAMTEALQQGIVSPIEFPGSRMDETLVLSLTKISSRVSLDSGFSTTQHHRFNVVFSMVTKK